MFWNSVKKTLFVPIATLVMFILAILTDFIAELLSGPDYSVNGYSYYNKYGYFWDNIFSSIILVVIITIIFAIISATVLFRFAQSKKQGNVIFSLGLSRRKIFLAKYLGGIVPLAAVLTFSAIIEIIVNLISGYIVKFPTIHLALISVVSMLGTYVLAFTIVATAMAFSGNIVEAGIFSVIIAFFPNFTGVFLGHMCRVFTHGGIETYSGDLNFFNPFFASFFMTFEKGGDTSSYLAGLYTGFNKLTINDWSSTITCFVISAIIFAIAYWVFPKRRNEISGFFGRAKGLNEICGAMVGFYVGTIVSMNMTENRSSVIAFVSFVLTFILVYLVFKFIFTYKRMKNMKQSAKRLVAYVAAFAVITVIFSTGLFGYSSYVPDAKKVGKIDISMEIANPYGAVNYEAALHRDEVYGYAPMTKSTVSYTSNLVDIILTGESTGLGFYFPYYTVIGDKEIEQVVEIHKALAKEGKLKSNADNVCGYNILIEYTLKNGKTVKRFYDTVSTESAIKALGLSDLSDFKSGIQNYFDYHATSTGMIATTSNYLDGFCMLPKNLKSCKYVDGLKYDFMKAILADLEKQSAQQIYFHNPEDELGVIYFPRDTELSSILNLADNEIIGSDGTIINVDTDKITGTVKERRADFPNLLGTSLSISSDKCIVVTKDMTNIIKYLTDKNLMQYFKSDITADDVKRIKIATRAETVGKKNSDMLPIFAAGYASADEIALNDTMSEQASHDFANHVSGSIKDKSAIQTVLDNALLYGYNGNDDRVVEVTYNDGSIATYAIKADVYSKLNIK